MAGRLLQRLASMNAVSQGGYAGLYAWAVTVAPAAWSRGAPGTARVAGMMALLALGAGFASPCFGERAQRIGLWGFVLASAAVWLAMPSALDVLRVDAARGLAGMLGWAVFALTSGAPARRPVEDVATRPRSFPPRQALAGGDRLYLAAGALGGAAIQGIGWTMPAVERALLVRCVVLTAGLALITTGAGLAVTRLQCRAASSPRRMSSLVAYLAALVALAIAGAITAVRGW